MTQVDVSTSFDFPVVNAAKALYSTAKSTLGSMVEFGKTALTTSFGKVIASIGPEKDGENASQPQASMLEYPPFVAGATP